MRLALVLALYALWTLVPAQRGRAFVSIEAHVGSAHAVHLGTVRSLEPSDDAKPAEGFFPGQPYRVEFAVTETIKGTRAKTLDLRLTLQHAWNLEYLRDHNIEVMLCATTQPVDEEAEIGLDGSRYSFRILAPVRHPRSAPETKWIADQMNVSLNEGRMFDLQLRVVSRRGEIVRRARAFAKAYPETLATQWIRVPNEFGVACGYTNAYCGITLPLCRESRQVAERLAKDPGRLLRNVKDGDLDWQRKSVLASLRQFLDLFEPQAQARRIETVSLPKPTRS